MIKFINLIKIHRKKLIAFLINFFMVGSGFVLYGKFWIGVIYLILFATLYAIHEKIGAMWAILVMVISYIHLYKVMRIKQVG